jgi:multisubunit Na+/H+ antiporter MnhC subunit
LGFGLLGTFVYLGLSIGSIIGAKIFTSSNYIRTIITLSLFFSAVTLLIFALTTNFELALTMRLLAGFFAIL